MQFDTNTILLIIISLSLGYLIYQGQQTAVSTMTDMALPRRRPRLSPHWRDGYRWGYPYYGSGYRRYYQ